MPIRTEYLPFARPDITDEEIAAVGDTLRGGWLTTGPQTKAFEQEFAKYLGVPHCVAVSSGTAALHLALLGACPLEPGNEVLIPTYTFAATGEVVVYTGATPVLVDSEPGGFNIDPMDTEKKTGPQTRAIIPVHIGGHSARMEPLGRLAESNGLAIIEDAAHAPPTFHLGRPAGTFGLAGAFSFYATKSIACGEGGMLVTSSEEIERKSRVLALHGISRDAWKRYHQTGSWKYEIEAAGYKYNMNDMAAACGRIQLKRLPSMHGRRVEIAQRYDEALGELEEIILPPRGAPGEDSWHLYPIRLNLGRMKIDRDRFIQRMAEEGVGTSVHFIPLHRHPYYRDRFGYRAEDFPNAEAAFQRVVSLPIYSAMSDEDVEDVIAGVKIAVGESGA